MSTRTTLGRQRASTPGTHRTHGTHAARGALRALGCLGAVATFLLAQPSHAEPGTNWSRYKNPQAERRRDLVAEAENLERKARHLMARTHSETFLAKTQLSRAAILLHEAGAATSPDPFLRYRLAAIYEAEERPELALPLLESVARGSPPAPLRAASFARLGIVYAQLGRVDDEIAAYGEALALQPIASERATLLSNRAEAYMHTGDVAAAVAGYRAALGLLSADYMVLGSGSTTLWGLGVALDRTGDLDSGLDAIRVARIYDRLDKNLEPESGWFYSPAHDRYWYEALGAWQVARKPDAVTSARVDAFARAVASWEEFLAKAGRDDKWAALARVRLKQCEKERLAFLKRVHSPQGLLSQLRGEGAPPRGGPAPK
jgi:tetratricopeptide (TPR) repeat protein